MLDVHSWLAVNGDVFVCYSRRTNMCCKRKKVKEVDFYSAFIVIPHTQGAQVQITQCYLQITSYLPLPRKHSPDGASPDWSCGHLIAAYYSFIYPERMKGWVGLVGWPTADGLPILRVVTRQPQVECRTAKVRLSETDVLPLCHATNYWYWYGCVLFVEVSEANVYPDLLFLGTGSAMPNKVRNVSAILLNLRYVLVNQ